MPRFLYSTEKWGGGATIQLDNKDVVIVSIDRGELLVRKTDPYEGLLKAIARNWKGTAIYRSNNRRVTAKIAEIVDVHFPQKIPDINFSNPVLNAFTKAIWHCQSADDFTVLLRRCEPSPKEAEMLTWSPFVNDEVLSFYEAGLRPNWKEAFIEKGCKLYNVIYSDGKSIKRFLTRDEVTT